MKDKFLRILPLLALVFLALTVFGSLVMFLAYRSEVRSYEDLYRENVFAQSSRLMRVSAVLSQMFAADPVDKLRRCETVVSQSLLPQPFDLERVFSLIKEDPLMLKARMLDLQTRQAGQVEVLAGLLEKLKQAGDPPGRAALAKDFENQARMYMNLVEERGSALSQFEAVFFNKLRMNRQAEQNQLGLLTWIQTAAVLLTVVVILYYLRAQQARIKTLHGLIPICSSCKKVRDDAGYWEQVEEYVRTRTEAEFTHGLCPDCIAKLYPAYADKSG